MVQSDEEMARGERRPSPERDDGISIIEVANVMLRHRWLIVGLTLVFSLALLLHAVRQQPTYSATVAFMPEGGGSQASPAGIARELGQLLGAGATPSSQFYAELLTTREILVSAVSSDLQFVTAGGDLVTRSLDDYYAASGEPVTGTFQAAATLQENITAVSRPTGIVDFSVEAADSAVAEQIARRLLDLVNAFIVSNGQEQASAEARFVARRMSEAQLELVQAEQELQTFLRQHRGFESSPTLIFEHDKLRRQVELRQSVYTMLAQSREQARISASRDLPLLTVIEPPEGSATLNGARPIYRATLGGVLGLALGLIVAFVSATYARDRGGLEAEDE